MQHLRATHAHGGPALRWLAKASDDTFYGRGSGVHYAAARYLMYYLQEAGLLRQLVTLALAQRDDDPTGFATLSRVLDQPDMSAFQQHWERWVTFLHPR